MSTLTQSTLPKDKPQINTERLLNAPRELVWKVLTFPEHLQYFWGPDGFTNSYKKFDLRVGGEALFTMHGPDGTDYPNRFIFRTITPPSYMAWDHDGGDDHPESLHFLGEIELLAEGNKTRIHLRLTVDSVAQRDEIAKYAVEGGIQNLDRLAAYVAPMAEALNRFVIERSFGVSQQRLFEVCSQVEHIRQWMSPAGMKVIKAEQDLKPGGTYHYGLATTDGHEMWGKITYKEITPTTRLVYLQSFSDKFGNITAHPMAPTWPKEMVTIFDFIPEGPNQTKLKITWTYAGIDDAEAATFHAAHAGMTGGWTGSLDQLQAYLAKS